ncbi:ornithine cyclodeaminase [Phaeobacter gallaeciensis]|uniref:Ornithine cyclodeaminase n=2 Tax=Roseobacteraceae TaxID=2854170 RepID=A0A366X029_9RHOB|nr:MULTISPECIES: ornithine cyclodeaminase [Roseobacteraceae]MBT3142054.1 ornithine cyclodeaminase [Falsiruegeria litorea]MBT8168600.1 ornithine cyclodeaminase [Falsiruegeria litorea]RBW53929.1 ornithine cyclodeaminase [Phaeobacter gallaeciensis]
MTIPFISFDDGETGLDWLGLTQALADGHALPKAKVGDTLLRRGPDTVLSRTAWIDGLGMAVKTATVFPGNPDGKKPMINGAVNLYDDQDGTLTALIDFHLVTKWKTAGDSLLAALRLAKPESREILLVGAGTVGQSLYEAFRAGFPNAQFKIWNRTQPKAKDFAKNTPDVEVAADLAQAVHSADIILSATMSADPIILGEWLRPGQHLNLIGAYRPDMREADDLAIKRSRIFVDNFDTTVDHIGELSIPLETGVIQPQDLVADFYDLGAFAPLADEITLFKNGGGAHLDLMTSRFILDRWCLEK